MTKKKALYLNMRLSNGPFFKWSRLAIVKKRHIRTLGIYGRFCELEIDMFHHLKTRAKQFKASQIFIREFNFLSILEERTKAFERTVTL